MTIHTSRLMFLAQVECGFKLMVKLDLELPFSAQGRLVLNIES